MQSERKGREFFLAAFDAWCACLVLLALPLYLLHNLDGFLNYMTAMEIASDTCLVALMLFGFALILAGIATLAARAFPTSWGRTVQDANLAAAASIVFLVLLRAVKQWAQAALDLRIPIGALKYPLLALTLIAVCYLAYRYRTQLRASASQLEGELAGLRRWLPWLAAIAILAPVLHGVGWMRYGAQDLPVAGAAAANQRPPNIFLITFDTLSAEDMSLYGYRLPTSTQLEKFSRVSDTFDNMISNCNFTAPAVTSILTGKYPTSHRVYQLYGGLRGEARNQTLARLLHDRGYRTAAFVSNGYAHPFHLHANGFDYVAAPPVRGRERHLLNALLQIRNANLISTLDEFFVAVGDVLGADTSSITPVPPQKVFDAAEDLIGAGSKQPLFIWTHVSPPHEPYLPPPPFRQSFLKTNALLTAPAQNAVYGFYTPADADYVRQMRLRYDEYTAYADDEAGRYLDFLRQHGYFDNSIIIVSADHGQSFEHGFYGHAGPLLYQPVIHVPLLVHLPGQTQGKRIEAGAEQVDLAPTLLNLVRAPVPNWIEGVSLAPVLHGQSEAPHDRFSMNLERESAFSLPHGGTVALLRGPYKYLFYLRRKQGELFDLAQDPHELHDLAAAEPALAASMRAAILDKTKNRPAR